MTSQSEIKSWPPSAQQAEELKWAKLQQMHIRTRGARPHSSPTSCVTDAHLTFITPPDKVISIGSQSRTCTFFTWILPLSAGKFKPNCERAFLQTAKLLPAFQHSSWEGTASRQRDEAAQAAFKCVYVSECSASAVSKNILSYNEWGTNCQAFHVKFSRGRF